MDDTKNTLISKYKELMKLAESSTKSANSIKEVLRILGYDIDISDDAGLNRIFVSDIASGFPFKESKRAHALWLLKNKFGRAAKMPDIQKMYSAITKSDEDIQKTVRTLKSKGKTASQNYGSNKETYWGLKEWHDGTDFKEEFKPNINEKALSESAEFYKRIGVKVGLISRN